MVIERWISKPEDAKHNLNSNPIDLNQFNKKTLGHHSCEGASSGSNRFASSRLRGSYSPGLHRLAIITAIATFPLIFMGGLVTSHEAGMSVPDWPNTWGYNMFTFPPSLWVGGIFYEHTHRLMGALVGLLAIALTAWAWLNEPRLWVRWLATSVLGAVIVQGVLGGLRVVLVELDFAIVHGVLAQAIFCLMALIVAVTSRWWHNRDSATSLQGSYTCPCQSWTVRLGVIAIVFIFAQLIVGAMMRHYKAGLAIPDLPLAYGQWLPPMDDVALKKVNHYRGYHTDLFPVTLFQIWLHFAHRIGAIIVSAAVVLLATHVLRRREQALLRHPAILLIILLVIQLTLGVLTVLMQKPADIASLHVAFGALTLFAAFTLTTRAVKLDLHPAIPLINAPKEADPVTVPQGFPVTA